MREVLLER
jgi:hypothetical protein